MVPGVAPPWSAVSRRTAPALVSTTLARFDPAAWMSRIVLALLTFLTAPTYASSNSSLRFSGTSTRVSEKQTCPVIGIEYGTRLPSTWPTSASSSTIAADLPPSSKLVRTNRSAATAAMCRPATVEPVKLILSIEG